MTTLLQDLRYAVRNLIKAPGFTAVALITLALGIGANTAIFSVVDAVLLRALPYFQPDRLVVLLHQGRNPVAPANYLDWQHDNHVFEQMGAAEAWTPNLTNVDTPEQVPGIRVSQEIFPLLGVRPALGRTFSADEEQSGRDHEVVLSYGLWQRRFGGDSGAVGRTLSLNGETYTVIGVMPQGFRFAPFWSTHAQIWAPLPLDQRATSRNGNSLRIFARLKPGVTLDQARAEIATITGRLEAQFPGTNQHVSVVPLKEKVVGDVRPALLVLLGAVGFVLLIGCANVAHMLLARAAARQREIAVRAALGASRTRVIRQLLTESTLLALVGGVFGLVIAQWSTHALLALAPQAIDQFGVRLDARVLLFASGIAILTGLLFGLAPALQLSVMNVAESLKEGARGSGQGLRSNRMRSLLISSEFALAVVLLAGAGLMVRSFIALQAIDPGFKPQHLVTMVVSLAGSENVAAAKRASFYERALQLIAAQPGVQSTSAINHLPLAGDLWGFPFAVQGRPLPRPGESPSAAYRVVLPEYFRTMNIPVLRGRDITAADNMNSPGVVIVNEFLANRYWPGEDPIGKRITLDDPTKNPAWRTVVGVVKNVVRSEWAAPAEEEMYLPFAQDKFYSSDPSIHSAYLTFVVRTEADPRSATGSIESAIHTLDKNVTISEVATMDEVVAEANAQPRFYLLLLGSFALLALVLAAVGIYGVMSHSVSRRTHEMALRMALGARQRDVLNLVVGESMLLALLGGTIGLIAALALTPLMSSLLYGTRAADPFTFMAVAALLGCVALLASYIPARRATKVDPIVALRYE